jgi:hypothetical protein
VGRAKPGRPLEGGVGHYAQRIGGELGVNVPHDAPTYPGLRSSTPTGTLAQISPPLARRR